jgi:hypothetical protein
VIRRLLFASCYVYSPDGSGAVCEHSRLLRSLLKESDDRFMEKYAIRVHQQVDGGSIALRGFFSADDILVPVPGSRADSADRGWAAGKWAKDWAALCGLDCAESVRFASLRMHQSVHGRALIGTTSLLRWRVPCGTRIALCWSMTS